MRIDILDEVISAINQEIASEISNENATKFPTETVFYVNVDGVTTTQPFSVLFYNLFFYLQ